MTNRSYKSNYIKIYFWQGAAFVLRFLSLFVVMPFLTKDPTTYGIYSVCVSVTIFLSYADLGFLRAGQKYAAECYSRDERADEMKYIGFGGFVMLAFTLLCAFLFVYLGCHPQNLIKGLDTPAKSLTASSLLFILALFAPFTVISRMVSMIFDIRLEGYINQRIGLFANIITITSVFYFFSKGNYKIVEYFLFSQCVNFIVTIICLWIAKRKYNYNIKRLFQSVRFDLIIYKRAKALAWSGLYVMGVWILFYELDQITIAKYLGVDKVAIYAIAITFSTFFRSIYGILFSPFTVRANYFVGKRDDEGLKRFCSQLISFSAPIVILPTVAFALVSKNFILSWVGVQYMNSIDLVVLFSFIYTFSFIEYSGSMILIAKERMNAMYLIATIQPVIFWGGILCTYSFLGLLSFAYFKLIATVVSAAYYCYVLISFLDITLKELFLRSVFPVVAPLVFLVATLLLANRYLPMDKGKINLLIVLGSTGLCILASFVFQYFSSSHIRIFAKNFIVSGLAKDSAC